MAGFNGLGMGLGQPCRACRRAQTRSISAENSDRRPRARRHGHRGHRRAWPPASWARAGRSRPRSTSRGGADRHAGRHRRAGRHPAHLADGPPAPLAPVWSCAATGTAKTTPSVETPLGDFFCNGWGERCNVTSLPIAVNPAGGFNSYWEMPFRQHARITVENLSPDEVRGFYYQIDYTLTEVPDDRAYLHAQWRRSNPLPYKAGPHPARRRAGPGALRRHLPGLGRQQQRLVGRGRDQVLPGRRRRTGRPSAAPAPRTISAAPGTSSIPNGRVRRLLDAVPRPAAGDQARRALPSQQRFGMYRWHVMDPIRFAEDLRVTIQALGWRSRLEGQTRYLPLQDDIASHRLLVPDRAARAVPGAAGPERAGSHLDVEMTDVWGREARLIHFVSDNGQKKTSNSSPALPPGEDLEE